jgi:hypothetical protein
MFYPVSEHAEAIAGRTYRSTYYFGGAYPNGMVRETVLTAVRTATKRFGKNEIIAQAFYSPEETAGLGTGAPLRSWSYRLLWRKRGTGTPLAFFIGPGGYITLAIVGVLIAAVSAVLVLRTIEETADEVPQAVMPFALLAAIGVVGLWIWKK